MTTACSPAPRDEKNRGEKKQQTDPRGEDNKEKQHKLYVWIYEMYIFRLETQTFLE